MYVCVCIFIYFPVPCFTTFIIRGMCLILYVNDYCLVCVVFHRRHSILPLLVKTPIRAVISSKSCVCIFNFIEHTHTHNIVYSHSQLPFHCKCNLKSITTDSEKRDKDNKMCVCVCAVAQRFMSSIFYDAPKITHSHTNKRKTFTQMVYNAWRFIHSSCGCVYVR